MCAVRPVIVSVPEEVEARSLVFIGSLCRRELVKDKQPGHE